MSYHSDSIIPPHGGQLVNRIATDKQRQEFLAQADFLPRLQLDERSVSDLEMIAIGGFSPLIGFMEQEEYEQIVTDMRLANSLPWSIPITLSVEEAIADSLKEGSWVRLDDPTGGFIGVLQLDFGQKSFVRVNVTRTKRRINLVYGSPHLISNLLILLVRDSSR
jgi:sulfate adenylyltransferase